MLTLTGKYTSALIHADNIEEKTLQQINKLTNHPSFTNSISIMPDAHAGAGGPIGFTMKLGNSVVPNIIGVDIGCGMLAIKLNGTPIKDLPELDKKIRQKIPFGDKVRDHNILKTKYNDFDFFRDANYKITKLWVALRQKFGTNIPDPPVANINWYQDLCKKVDMDFQRAENSIGTLGGGNHFIEFGISEKENPDQAFRKFNPFVTDTWIIIHSGSRQLGKKICDYHQNIARKSCSNFNTKKHEKELDELIKKTAPSIREEAIKRLKQKQQEESNKFEKGLEPLSGKDFYNYLYDMVFAQHYASVNREVIAKEILEEIVPANTVYAETIETIHNYINPDDLIMRKGAVSSKQGERIVIPFNMKDGTWICTGKGKSNWNSSAPHGAGRIMSRSEAKRTLKQEDAEKEMEGIYTSCIPLDEAPASYKPAKDIQKAIIETADVSEKIKPIMNLKTN